MLFVIPVKHYICDGVQSSQEACEKQLVDTNNKPTTDQNDRQLKRSIIANYSEANRYAKRGGDYIK